MKVTIIKPTTKEKKLYKTGGKFFENEHCNPVKLSVSQILTIVKRTHKRLGVTDYIKTIEIVDCGDYFTCFCC